MPSSYRTWILKAQLERLITDLDAAFLWVQPKLPPEPGVEDPD
jgi:hypothetical protein